jgi:hypothetical protein
MMVSHREQEIPEERQLLLPGRLVDRFIVMLDLLKGGVGRGMEPLFAKFIIYAIMNRIHPFL